MDATAELIKDLESTLAAWRNALCAVTGLHVAKNPAGDLMAPASGFNSALSTCAKQLADTLDRYRANTED